MTCDDPIYLDYNATTPIAAEVVEAMLPYLTTHFGNPSSGHVYGGRARTAVELARSQVAGLIGAPAHDIVFTGSGSEANNLLILGLANKARPSLADDRRHVVFSAVEHPAVAKPCRSLAAQGWRVSVIPVDRLGRVDMERAAALLSGGATLVSVMHSNNEVGSVQPIAELAGLAHRAGALMHTDAAQSIGKIPLDVDRLAIDAMTIVGHKIYAPKGIGALYLRDRGRIAPVMLGGGQEQGMRPGTENVALIVALGAACALAARRIDDDQRHLRAMRDRLMTALQADIPGLLINGDPAAGLPHCLNVSFPGVLGSRVLAGARIVAASTGSACHEGGETPSDILVAMGCDRDRALGAVRLSVGRPTTAAMVDTAAAALIRAWRDVT
ncbi:MAG: cysteine desulfurase [Telmatospirillum sp.]|nr:cysteine desulfurase [Telmatospirillum sp.]